MLSKMQKSRSWTSPFIDTCVGEKETVRADPEQGSRSSSVARVS